MQIEKLRLKDFRNYAGLELDPHPGINLLFGQNGSGKTNLLEAIHYCALGRSHRTAPDREVVRKGAESAAVGVTVRSGGTRSEIAVRLTPGELPRKRVFIDRKRSPRLSSLMGRLRCVIFSPEDLLIVREGPSARRRYIDMMVSQLSESYFTALQRYQRALEQRSAALREMRHGADVPPALLDAFEDEMARCGAQIIPRRRREIARCAGFAEERYASVCGRADEHFGMRYECCAESDDRLEEVIAENLRASRHEDMLRGGTGFGPHREDIRLTLNGREMKLFASQGQVRTAALSMKLAQLSVLEEASGDTPILLLDDVMSELDMTRRTRLLREIGGVQTFVTCTDESDLEGCGEHRSYRVALTPEQTAVIAEETAGAPVARPEDAEPDFS